MELHLLRTDFQAACTIGVLSIDGAFFCYSLEDRIHDGSKLPGETAIPEGRYEVRMSWSNRFASSMPHLVDVPGFTGILIHPGNTDKDTAGCILVGQRHEGNHLLESRLAFDALVPKLVDGIEAGGCWLTITGKETP
jgi:hypothetical protein